ncbi:hypothetical protein BC936DRAFT_144349 [Jimgerdemannia flammicorona]|uniref:Glucosamine 6-phosphate N-acetyltransferase n=1 Tax=Jimgerdemannia flammicorona TaxID=994334 RepID=A0A433DCN8_9FUNG|nr:hypothetical protein BC936DRAFT_144349 [Jimgerdemannia flammicorona]
MKGFGRESRQARVQVGNSIPCAALDNRRADAVAKCGRGYIMVFGDARRLAAWICLLIPKSRFHVSRDWEKPRCVAEVRGQKPGNDNLANPSTQPINHQLINHQLINHQPINYQPISHKIAFYPLKIKHSTMPASHSELLFSYDLISPEVQAALPQGYHLRALAHGDYERGFLKTLAVLTEVGNHSKADWMERFDYLKKHNHEYFTIVIVDPQDRVVAAGTIFVERKFVHLNGLVGHIEDIAVDGNQQGKKFGLRIIQALKFIGAKTGCYKVILDCSQKNIPFYEKCGFTHKEYEMAWYVPKDAIKAKL